MAAIPSIEVEHPEVIVAPVTIQIVREHGYRSRGKNKNGCGVKLEDGTTCMRAQAHPCHLGLPLSINEIGSRGGYHTYRTFKHAWEAQVHQALVDSGLPRGWEVKERRYKGEIKRPAWVPEEGTPKIHYILVETEVCFPTMPDTGRDQDNFRWFTAKVVGDVLKNGGWLKDDEFWPVRRYEHGGLEMRYEKGVASTWMTLMPDLGLRGNG